MAQVAQRLLANQFNAEQLAAVAQFTGGRLGNLLTLGELHVAATSDAMLPAVREFVKYCNQSTVYFRSVYGKTFASEVA